MATAKKSADEQAATKVITDVVRFSYVHVWEPTSMQDGTGEKKYSVSLIIPKSNTELIARINAAVLAAKEMGRVGKFGGKIPANLKMPLRDGDKERPDDDSYANSFFVTASSKTKPGIVGLGNPPAPITDETEVYSGCYGRASINFYPFNASGSKGIACGLNHVQKVRDGEALGGRGKAEDDFADELPDTELLGDDADNLL